MYVRYAIKTGLNGNCVTEAPNQNDERIVMATKRISKNKSDEKPYQAYSHRSHGHTSGRNYSPTYQSWQSMLARCRYKNRDHTANYLDRGIKVCTRWNKFENFLSDMGERPVGKTLDRKNPNKGYNKNNCRWATATEQARNCRRTKLTYEKALSISKRLLKGERGCDLAKEYKISPTTVYSVGAGRTWKDAYDAARKR